MEQHEQERFDQLYAKHLQALKLQGKRSKTIDGYARAVRRITGFFNRCPDNLSATELKTYFAWMVENYSWSSVKVDLWGLSFFYRHVLGQPMDWVDIIKPPKSRSLPDIPTREEVQLLINSVYRLRYRVYFFVVYSMGLHSGKGSAWRLATLMPPTGGCMSAKARAARTGTCRCLMPPLLCCAASGVHTAILACSSPMAAAMMPRLVPPAARWIAVVYKLRLPQPGSPAGSTSISRSGV